LAGFLSPVRNTVSTRFDSVYSIAHGGNADGASDVSTYAEDAASHCYEGALATAAPACSHVSVERIKSAPKNIVVTIESHKCLRNVGFAVYYCSSGKEHGYEWRSASAWFQGEGNDAYGTVHASNAEGVFKGYGYSMEGSKCFTMLRKVVVEVRCTGKGLVEEYLCEAIGLVAM